MALCANAVDRDALSSPLLDFGNHSLRLFGGRSVETGAIS
jgi:hypothetical protein